MENTEGLLRENTHEKHFVKTGQWVQKLKYIHIHGQTKSVFSF